MRKVYRPLMFLLLFIVVFFAGSCAKTAENEHLPDYCQTYSGFTGVASKDLYDLIRDNYPSELHLNRSNYYNAISTIDLEFTVDDPAREIDLSGLQCFQNLTNLTLTGRSFKDLSPISALSSIQSIELNGTSVVSIDSFKNLSKIKSLVISDTRTLQSVDGVEEMTKLTTLDLSNNGLVVIDGLNNLTNLQNLYLNDNDIKVFPSINALKDLEYLDISDNDIDTLGDLSGLTALKELDAENNEIVDISAFGDLISLEKLILSNNRLGSLGIGVSPDFSSLQNATDLVELRLDNNNLTSIEGLRGYNFGLTTLYLNDNNLTDITPIAGFTAITTLAIDNNNIVNINDLSGMTGLTSIDLSDNLIVDFSDLRSITGLETIDLSDNRIEAIPDLSASWDSLTVLDLRSNNLSDTSGLAGHQYLETVYLMNNGLVELSGINNMPALDELVIFDEDYESELEFADQNPNAIRIIRDSFFEVPQLDLTDELDIFELWFEVEPNLEIYNSIKGLTNVGTIDFTSWDVDVIDEFSIELPNCTSIYVSDNDITDIRFLLGNPLLERINISSNPVANLEVISGSGIDDFDNLVEVFALAVTGENNIANAFIELPAIEEINLLGANIITITDSFNDLATLETLIVDGGSLTEVVNSFNDIFATYSDTNTIDWSDGAVGLISDSFNNGNYEYILIDDQETTVETTAIINSFINITTSTGNSIDLSGSDFATIEGSFTTVTSDLINISNSKIVTITTSFIDNEVDTTNLALNTTETVEDSFTGLTAESVNLSNSDITSVDGSFLDSTIDDLNLAVNGEMAILDSFTNLISDTVSLASADVVSTDNSFKDSEITTFDMSGSGANVITNSFTGLTITTMNMSGGDIASITSSFKESEIDTIDLSDNAITIVDDSFVDITALAVDLSGNAITTVNVSFVLSATPDATSTIDTLNLSDNVIDTITTSFTDTTFVNLDLSFNQLASVTSLQDVASVEVIFLNDNVLTTLSFLDAIEGVTELHIDNQYIPGAIPTPTLTSLDGVNNMASLTTFTYANIGITEIHGLMNIGVTSLDFSKTTNILEITTIHEDSFSGTPLTSLNLNGHELTVLTFMANLTLLEEFEIGINLPNLDDFTAAPFKTTVTDLTIKNAQNITDYTPLQNYNVLESFTLDLDDLLLPAFTTEINNLDNMDSLVSLTLPFAYVTDVDTSFNNMLVYNPGTTFLTASFDDTLTNIDNSFDMYGTGSIEDEIDIPASAAIVDSFNNAVTVNILSNDDDLAPLFDTLSFTNVENITFEFADYSDFSFLDGYDQLTSLVIEDLDVDITTLSSSYIDTFTINDASALVDEITVTLEDGASFNIVSSNTTTLTLITNADNYDINAPLADVVISPAVTTVTTMILSADVGEFTLNNDYVTTVDLDNFETANATFNTDALTTVSRSTTIETNATTFTINTLEATLDISTRATDLIINDNNATDYTIVVNDGNTTINGNETDIVIDISSLQLDISYATLEDVTLTGGVGTVNITSAALDNINATATMDDIVVNSDVATLTLALSDVTNVDVVANNVTTLTVDASGAIFGLSTTSNQPLSATIDVDTLNFTGNLVPSITLNTTSAIDTLNLDTNNALGTLDYTDATLNTVVLSTNETTLTISGTTSASFDLSGADFAVMNINAALADFVINDAAATLDASIVASDVDFVNTSLATLDLDVSSDIDNLDIDSVTDFTTLTSNDSNIDVLDIDTGATSITVNAINALNTTINGDNFNSAVVYLGDNTGTLTSNNAAALSLDATAGTFSLDGDLTSLTIDTDSVITTLNLNTASNNNIVGNGATITLLDIANIGTDTDISGTNITELTIDDTVSVLELDLELATIVSITTSIGIDLTVDTSEVSLAAGGNSTITTATVDSLILDLGSNNLDITDNKAALNLTIDGTAGDVTLSGSSFDNVTTTAATNLDLLILNNVNITSLDFTLGSIGELQVTTAQTNLTVVGDETVTFTITGANLDNVDITSSAVSSTLTLDSNAASLTVAGNVTTTAIDNDSLSTLTLTGLTTDSITVDSINTALTMTGSIDTTTINNDNLDDLTVTGYTTTDLTVNTLATTLDIDGTVTNITVDGDNLNTITGFSATDLDVSTLSASLELDGSATSATITNNSLATLILTNFTSTDIDVTSTNASLDLQGSATSMVINNNSLTSLTFTTFSATNLTLNTTDLATLNSGSSISGDLVITTNQASFTLVADSATLDYSGATTGTLDLTTTTIDTLTTNVEVLDLAVTTASLTISGANVQTVNGSVVSLDFTGGSGTLTLDLDVTGTLDMDSATYTGISFDGARTINTFNPNNSALTFIDTNSVTVTNFSITTTESTFRYDGDTNVVIDYTDTSLFNLTINTTGDITVNISNATAFLFDGTVGNLTITGSGLTAGLTTSLNIDTSLTMNDTSITDLSFLSATAMTNIDTITVNTLSNTNIESIINTIDGYTVSVVSPIIDDDVHTYYDNLKNTELTDQEALDNVRYNAFRDTAINDAWAVIITNGFMDQLDESTTKAEIDAQVYQSATDYLALWLDSEGYENEAAYDTANGAGSSDTARDSIQATLDDPALTIVEATLNQQVTDEIAAEATSYADDQLTAKTYTLS